ncbi:hypothetical protein AM1_5015 [Acaryochloris marina MBIC11017]|uniref:Uncharacterized protein n=1 Tax=Acaryochloris marina (strain MBIC 11017) TaxID=329726 RepID=B0C5W8_ACAM1|nr:hypothetical protein AM1_5015 [Acaryochloris marina MBIC11017]
MADASWNVQEKLKAGVGSLVVNPSIIIHSSGQLKSRL